MPSVVAPDSAESPPEANDQAVRGVQRKFTEKLRDKIKEKMRTIANSEIPAETGKGDLGNKEGGNIYAQSEDAMNPDGPPVSVDYESSIDRALRSIEGKLMAKLRKQIKEKGRGFLERKLEVEEGEKGREAGEIVDTKQQAEKEADRVERMVAQKLEDGKAR